MRKRGKNETGATGAFLVAAELSRRGWPASVTHGAAPRTDVLAQVGDDLLPAAIQVKTKGENEKDWRLAKGISDASPPGANEWVVLVALRHDVQADFYVLPRNQLRGYVVAAPLGKSSNTWGALGPREFPRYCGQWELMEQGAAQDAPCLVERWVIDVLEEHNETEVLKRMRPRGGTKSKN